MISLYHPRLITVGFYAQPAVVPGVSVWSEVTPIAETLVGINMGRMSRIKERKRDSNETTSYV